MLSYRHAFHAGNHADILKHYTLSLVLNYFNNKHKPYSVIDTHAGAGLYSIDNVFAKKNNEYETGFTRLLAQTQKPIFLNDFMEMIASFNPKNTFQYYPGSPKVTEHYLRESDQLFLFELHPNEFQILNQHFKLSKRTKVKQQDGFKGLIATLPPTTKRGVVMIDPPYENKSDYKQVVETIQKCLKRFETGCYIIWYPLLHRSEPKIMIEDLKKLKLTNWLNVTLTVNKPNESGIGMYGSGLFIINQPWTLAESLKDSLPYFEKILGTDNQATSQLEFIGK
jgi:23S rRNA (adenine2030-N6)-methyltransferase